MSFQALERFGSGSDPLPTLQEKGYIVERQIKGYIVTDKGTQALKEYYPYCVDRGATKQPSKHADKVKNAIRMIELGY